MKLDLRFLVSARLVVTTATLAVAAWSALNMSEVLEREYSSVQRPTQRSAASSPKPDGTASRTVDLTGAAAAPSPAAERPLFDRSRRPPQPVPLPPPAPTPPLPGPIVAAPPLPPAPPPTPIGVVFAPDRHVVMFKLPDGQVVAASKGDTVGAWTVGAIEASRIVVSQNGVSRELHMFPAASAPASGVSLGGAPAPPLIRPPPRQ